MLKGREDFAAFLISILVFSSAFVLIQVDPMIYVIQRRLGTVMPETTNVVSETFRVRGMISNGSLQTVTQIVVGGSVFLQTTLQ